MLFEILLSVFLSGVSLSMDAFAVSICNGMIYKNLDKKRAVSMPAVYGIFQAVMPILGFYVGLVLLKFIDPFDHWIAFLLLLFIGGKMVLDGAKEYRMKEEEIKPKNYSFKEVLVQGVATSIDALAVGFSLNAMLAGLNNVQLWAWISVIIIGLTTFTITLVGVIIGVRIGKLFKKKACVAEIIGGLVLIGIGLKILIEGLL